MAGFAGHTPPAAVELAVQHQSPADPGPDCDHHEVIMTSSGAELGLGPRRRVSVVLHHHRAAGTVLDMPRYRLVAPGQIGREHDRRAALLDKAGRPAANGLDFVPGHQFPDRVADLLDDPGCLSGRPRPLDHSY